MPPADNLTSARRAAERRAVAAELERRKRLPAAVDALVAGLFPVQRDFALCTSPRIVARAGRRGGKTHGIAARAFRAALRYPKRTIPVIERTLTSSSARVLWEELQAVDKRFGLNAKFHHSLLIATLGNVSQIQVVGADTVEAADKLRGGNYPEAIVDEAGTFRDYVLTYLLNEVLGPALLDHGGTLVLSGTPGARPIGTFYEACTRPDAPWERFYWTFRDNLAIPMDRPKPHPPYTPEERAAAREAWFAELLAANGWTEATPFVRREYFGEWIVDDNRMAYALAPYNYRGVELPASFLKDPARWSYGLGIDLGFNDPTAFVVVGRERGGDGTLWVIESYEQAGLTPSAVAAHVERLRTRYRFGWIVADTGGYGKGPVAEMASARWGIPIIAAQKRGKAAHRTFVNGDLGSGRIRIIEASNRDLILDMGGLRLDEKGEEDPRDPNHLPDAFLYVATHMATVERGFGARAAADPGSPEWLAELERRVEELAARELERPEDEAVAQLPWA